MAKGGDDWHEVMVGSRGRVVLTGQAKVEYDKIQIGTDVLCIRQRTAIRMYFERFCADDTHLNNEQFKKETNAADGVGGKVAIWTFKAFKWRVYGAVFPDHNGLKTFWGGVVDPQKKQNKADPNVLKKAGLVVGSSQAYAAHKKRRERT